LVISCCCCVQENCGGKEHAEDRFLIILSSPDTFFGDPTKADGGNIIAHSSTYRVYLRKSGENRVAKMMDSPYHLYSDTILSINEKGADDIEEEEKRRRRKKSVGGKKASKTTTSTD
jgi:DNA repair protein RadA